MWTQFQDIYSVCQRFPENNEFVSMCKAAFEGELFEPPMDFQFFLISFCDFFFFLNKP